MEVNDELAVLRRALPAAIDAIAVGGRVVVESYHSLEDRLVKQAFTAATRSDVPRRTCRSCPRAASRPSGWSPAAPSRPTPPRSPTNPRAASVRLRAVERSHDPRARGAAR